MATVRFHLATSLLLVLTTCLLLAARATAQNASYGAASSSWRCDISQGAWVPSWRNLPLYTGLSCPYVRSSQNCQKQGRTDLQYQKYRWIPKGCRTQRLTPKRLLAQFRNKLVIVFGDSVSKNFAASVSCVLHAAAPKGIRDYRVERKGTMAYGVQIPRYNIRFVSVFSNWLTKATSLGGSQNRIDLDQIDPEIVNLLPLADIVVFQATNWWFPPINKWYVGGKEQKLTKPAAYEIGLRTLRDHVVRSGFKGKAAMIGVSPSHYNLPVAGVKGGSCEVSSMLTWQQTTEVRKQDSTLRDFRSAQLKVLSGSPIRYVDVRPMSDWRPDGHIQKWSVKGGAPPSKNNDCLHWCEGGVTDAWLEMLHNSLIF